MPLTDVDNTIQTEKSNALDGSYFNKGDLVYAIITPNDGIENGTAFTTDTVEILNSVPYWNIEPLITGSSLSGETVTCTGEVFDLDEETASNEYIWTSSDGTILSTTSEWTVDTSIVPPQDTIECTITATDSDDASITDSTSITIENTPPTVIASLSPTNPYTNTTIELTTQYSDPDTTQNINGTIEWHVIDALTGVDNTIQTEKFKRTGWKLFQQRRFGICHHHTK